MKVLELKGYSSMRALNAFHTLMLGLKMLPEYLKEDYETFYSRLSKMPPEDQMKMIRQAAFFVELQPAEVEALICFCVDPNGVPYSKENMKNMAPDQILEAVVAVCFEISKIKIDLVTDAEKKNLKTSQ